MTKQLREAATDALLLLEAIQEVYADDQGYADTGIAAIIESLQEAIENTVLTEGQPTNIDITQSSQQDTRKPILKSLERCFAGPILKSVQQIQSDEGLAPQDAVTVIGTFSAGLMVRAAHRNATAFKDAQEARAYIKRYCVILSNDFMEGVENAYRIHT